MKMTKEQKKAMSSKDWGILGKILFATGALKVVKIESYPNNNHTRTITDIYLKPRVWHPMTIVALVIMFIASAFVNGVPETIQDVKRYLHSEGERFRIYE